RRGARGARAPFAVTLPATSCGGQHGRDPTDRLADDRDPTSRIRSSARAPWGAAKRRERPALGAPRAARRVGYCWHSRCNWSGIVTPSNIPSNTRRLYTALLASLV